MKNQTTKLFAGLAVLFTVIIGLTIEIEAKSINIIDNRADIAGKIADRIEDIQIAVPIEDNIIVENAVGIRNINIEDMTIETIDKAVNPEIPNRIIGRINDRIKIETAIVENQIEIGIAAKIDNIETSIIG